MKVKGIMIAFLTAALALAGRGGEAAEYPPTEMSFYPDEDTSAGWNPDPASGGRTGDLGSDALISVVRETVQWEENAEQKSDTRNMYGYVKFNLAFFRDKKVRVKQGLLELTQVASATDEGRECAIGAHKLVAAGSDYGGCDWNEHGLLSNNGTSWRSAAVASLTEAAAEGGRWTFDVTPAVSEWVDRNLPNCGFLMTVDTAGPPALGYRFSSKEGANAPLLRIQYYTDNDGDWYYSNLDCNDGESGVFPLSPEKCDDIDNDCDGETDNGELCPRGEICQNGQCTAQCKDDCSAGDAKCDGETSMSTCDYHDGDNCLEWGASQACATGETCIGGRCGCGPACEEGQRRCGEGGAVERCEKSVTCAYWRRLEQCGVREECVEGGCKSIWQEPDAGPDAGGGEKPEKQTEDEGCGCRAAGERGGSFGPAFLLGLAACVFLRRRGLRMALVAAAIAATAGCTEKENGKKAECADDGDCAAGYTCSSGKCVSGQKDAGPEPDGGVTPDAGDEIPPAKACEPGWKRCKDETTLFECSADGSVLKEIACEASAMCRGAECVRLFCIPQETQCLDSDTLVACNAEGTAFEGPKSCREQDPALVCSSARCANLCEEAVERASYIGCEYWSVDLDNSTESDPVFRPTPTAAYPHAVAVSNPQLELPATVRIFTKSGELQMANNVIPPKGIQIYELPRADLDGSGIFPNAYRVESSVPVTAYQFNPLQSVETYSNDASLLFPSSSLGSKYVAMSWPQQNFVWDGDTLELPGFITVVAVEEGTTNVEVKVSCNTRSGIEAEAIPAGETAVFALERFEALNLESADDTGDLTGSQVNADKRVAVFGGHKCANVPRAVGWCDHLEQQILPTFAWGMNFIAALSQRRATGDLAPDFRETDVFRVLASEDGTTVRTDPPQPGTPATLDRGEFIQIPSDEELAACPKPDCEAAAAWEQCVETCTEARTDYFVCVSQCFESENVESCLATCPKAEDFEVIADKPVAVGQFFVGRNYANPTGWSSTMLLQSGDPTFITLVPVEQFRTEYIFFTPLNYQYDYVNLIAPEGTDVVIDGIVPESEVAPVGSHGFSIYRIPLRDGAHILRSSHPSGIISYGYDADVSYGYPGGLDLKKINPETP